MNNELAKDRADILADELLAYHNKGVCGRAAKMLRQQQAEIEALKNALRMKVILNEHAQQSMKGYKELLK